jgi:hypothetical protein
MSLLEPFFNDYKAHDTDAGGSTKYYGFADRHGNWIIMEATSSDTVFRFATNNSETGMASYADAWTARASHTYGYLYEVMQ